MVEFTFNDAIQKFSQLSIDCEEAVRLADEDLANPHELMVRLLSLFDRRFRVMLCCLMVRYQVIRVGFQLPQTRTACLRPSMLFFMVHEQAERRV